MKQLKKFREQQEVDDFSFTQKKKTTKVRIQGDQDYLIINGEKVYYEVDATDDYEFVASFDGNAID